jgi:hypothetical protein
MSEFGKELAIFVPTVEKKVVKCVGNFGAVCRWRPFCKYFSNFVSAFIEAGCFLKNFPGFFDVLLAARDCS